MTLLLNPHTIRRSAPSCLRTFQRGLKTLESNPSIYIHSIPGEPHVLSYLSTTPVNESLAIGTTATLPPNPSSVRENHNFLRILHSVLRQHATSDPDTIAAARAMASPGGAGLGSGGVFFPQQQHTRRRKSGTYGASPGGTGAGPASAQGGMGGAGRGGWIHVSDQRAPPDWGRVADPEDIFGSLEVDGEGQFVGPDGNYQESGTYRVVTRNGILGLSPFLRDRLLDRLRELEKSSR